MTCALAPSRTCFCCLAGKPCAYVLQIGAALETRLARVLALVGENPTRHAQTSKVVTTVTARALDDEPVTTYECDDCGSLRTQYTFIADFMKRHGFRQPACFVCDAARRAA